LKKSIKRWLIIIIVILIGVGLLAYAYQDIFFQDSSPDPDTSMITAPLPGPAPGVYKPAPAQVSVLTAPVHPLCRTLSPALRHTGGRSCLLGWTADKIGGLSPATLFIGNRNGPRETGGHFCVPNGKIGIPAYHKA